MRKELSPHLRPVREVEAPSLQFRTIHGYRRAFRIAGSGPALLLIHGVGDNSRSWDTVHAKLAQRFTVIAPDLLGHGESDKPHADYSLPAFANGMRDLLAVLGIDRVTVVGHSFGGGVAMQFAYQYPQLVERIVLVSAGGVAKDVSLALRLAAMPLGAEALGVLRAPGVMPTIRRVGRAVQTMLGSTRFGRDAAEVVDLLEGFLDRDGLAAFARTLRSVVDARGQYVTMLDRSYLVKSVPVQIIWGEDDLIIPVDHAHTAHAAMPGSRIEIFEDSGHMPFHDHPDRFVEVVERFVDSTRAADYDPDTMPALLRTGGREDLAADPRKAAVS
ncbi:alpha/beta fold hydrolase [Mycobacterium terramassiliense]|uniref:Lysophospholipase, alpha-beta hydrolase superfamily n=1 Tax=Mycobacterium terramassiliense TaxID=1841859 RepID=A0A2U3NJP3_9MYCO|nr:alpha/beta hydrolase [Mycobacterium terramassiliense]SPM31751.1 Lysophospholipase, alpha-beta hydrolase superfamily [Mycobacterium terramassiliense]